MAIVRVRDQPRSDQTDGYHNDQKQLCKYPIR